MFQSSGASGNHLYVVSAEGGKARRISSGQESELQPNWSPDGKWIYFLSDRTGAREIWRIPADGGEASRVTGNGGEFARIAPERNELYFIRGSYGSLELWKQPLSGGAATRVETPPIYDWGFTIAGSRLYFTTGLAEGGYPVMALDLDSGNTETMARIGFSPFAKFTVSPDGEWLAYSQVEQLESDLMLVDRFR